jgi:predicted DNA-binding transcriptional regulator YafY
VTARVTVSLTIENHYELYESVTTHVDDAPVEAPDPDDLAADDLDDWATDQLYDYTGTDHVDGDSWYDVTITASSEPRLVWKEFGFGY